MSIALASDPAGSYPFGMPTTDLPSMKRMTISIDAEVYDGLVRVVGRRHISRFLEDLARPHVTGTDLDDAYRAMAADEEREVEALDWSEGLMGSGLNAPR